MRIEAFLTEAEGIEGLQILRDEPLANRGSFHIGGNLPLALFPENTAALTAAVRSLRQYEIPFDILGKGSNVLFSDDGYEGAILFTDRMNGIRMEGTTITADAGVSFTALAAAAEKSGLSGLEFAYGIPGSVGGAVYMNAGAYGGEVSQVLAYSRYYDLQTDTVGEYAAETHAFGYRESIYRRERGKLILSASFALQKCDQAEIKAKMDDYMSRRKEKQPLEYPSAGSTFKRPTGLFAGKLIEDAGLKGLRVGGAQVSEKHAGFLINRDRATARDVMELVKEVQKRVNDRFGVMLEREIVYFGSDDASR